MAWWVPLAIEGGKQLLSKRSGGGGGGQQQGGGGLPSMASGVGQAPLPTPPPPPTPPGAQGMNPELMRLIARLFGGGGGWPQMGP